MTYRVDFLVVTNAAADVIGTITTALHSAVSVASDEPIEDDALGRSITINYSVSRPDGQRLTGFSIDFEAPNEASATAVIEEFGRTLRDSDEAVEHLLKLSDPVQRAQHRQLGDQLHVVEMKLREALSLIFVDTYGVDYYTLLRDVDAKPREKIQADVMRDQLENEFYFLLFSDYINLHSRKRPTLDQLCEFIGDATDYATLQRLVAYTPIVQQRYVDFLASLQTRLDPIERLRNCVAHNRAISARVMQNYEMARGPLLDAINEFLRGAGIEGPPATAPAAAPADEVVGPAPPPPADAAAADGTAVAGEDDVALAADDPGAVGPPPEPNQ